MHSLICMENEKRTAIRWDSDDSEWDVLIFECGGWEDAFPLCEGYADKGAAVLAAEDLAWELGAVYVGRLTPLGDGNA